MRGRLKGQVISVAIEDGSISFSTDIENIDYVLRGSTSFVFLVSVDEDSRALVYDTGGIFLTTQEHPSAPVNYPSLMRVQKQFIWCVSEVEDGYTESSL